MPEAPCSIMGIVNTTPDSFYDGGRYAEGDRAVEHGLALWDHGADWVDVGGESTRPGAEPVPEPVERDRVIPVIERLHRARPQGRISVDTRRPGVARAALEAGAAGVNDVTALADPAMVDLVREADCTVFLMHMRGEPRSMQRDPRYRDVLEEVSRFLEQRADRLLRRGHESGRIWLDPGIGFGKNDDHNAILIRGIPELARLGHPVLVGASRKSFIGRSLGLPDPADRMEGSLALASLAAWLGASMVRVHDVLETRRAVDMIHAVRAGSPPRRAPPREGRGASC